MGSSCPSVISPIMRHLQGRKMDDILDIGVGEAGQWGFLIRDKFDSVAHGRKFRDRSTWRLMITGIEICEKYHNLMHDYCYNKMYWRDAFEALRRMKIGDAKQQFDLVIFTSTIEHFDKERGYDFLAELASYIRHGGMLVMTTPNGYEAQPPTDGNPDDEHKCGWELKDFDRVYKMGYKLFHTEVTYSNRLIVIMTRG